MKLVLASGSPRRKSLLEAAGFFFEVVPSAAEETFDAAIPPGALTVLNAARKAEDVAARHPDAIVIGADTLVFLDNRPLGKPRDLAEAGRTLRALAGRSHQVVTGVALRGRAHRDFFEATRVKFRDFDDALIARYLAAVNVLDKAGAYAIQEHGDWLVESVEGCADNVMGFPVRRFVKEWAAL